MDLPKKLKRGLRDISPLFQPSQREQGKAVLQPPSEELEWAGIVNADAAEDSLFLSSYMASRLIACGYPCSILSLYSKRNAADSSPGPQNLRGPLGAGAPHRFSLSWDAFEAMRQSVHLQDSSSPEPSQRVLFLDADYSEFHRYFLL